MKTAQEVFASFGKPGAKVNSKAFSHFHSDDNFQVGGNRLTGAWHPQVTIPPDRKKLVSLTARPTQFKTDASGASGRAGQKVPFNNVNNRHLAGSVQAGVGSHTQRGANTLHVQRTSRSTARDLTGLDITSRRGGGSNSHFAKPVAGTVSTFAVPSPTSTGRQLQQVTSVHHIGLHKVVSTKLVDKSVNRLRGQI